MKNNDNDKLLAHKQQVDAERRAQAVLREQHRRRQNAQVMARIARLRAS